MADQPPTKEPITDNTENPFDFLEKYDSVLVVQKWFGFLDKKYEIYERAGEKDKGDFIYHFRTKKSSGWKWLDPDLASMVMKRNRKRIGIA